MGGTFLGAREFDVFYKEFNKKSIIWEKIFFEMFNDQQWWIQSWQLDFN